MVEHPCLMNALMVRAILAGRKWQTRRVMKPQPPEDSPPICVDWNSPAVETKHGMDEAGPEVFAAWGEDWHVRSPQGAPGDRLWVRETWAPCEAPSRKGCVQYAADGAVMVEVTTNGGERWMASRGLTLGISSHEASGYWVGRPSRWRPSIFMRRAASRLTLEVLSVRVERLQDITDEDARAEGVEHFYPADFGTGGWKNYGQTEFAGDHVSYFVTARESFASLWDSINGPGAWDANPWVWVTSFPRAEVARV